MLSTSATLDLLTDIITGLGAHTQISYDLLTDTATYTPETGGTYPARNLLTSIPMYVVSDIAASNGVGGQSVTTYHYTGAKAHLQGRGFLGFRVVETADQQTGIVSRTDYRQDYPYTGLPSHSARTTQSGVLLNQTDTTYAAQSLGGTRYFPYAAQSVESRYELDGSLVASTTTTQQYDTYGNPTQIVVSSNDGHSKTTVNSYDNDITNWILGRLRRATVTSTAP